jgi:hypothetical protein
VGGSYVLRASSSILDDHHNAFDIFQNVVVPKPKHAIAARSEKFGAFGVSDHSAVLCMTATINLNNELSCVAAKINEITTDCSLPPKMGTFE